MYLSGRLRSLLSALLVCVSLLSVSGCGAVGNAALGVATSALTGGDGPRAELQVGKENTRENAVVSITERTGRDRIENNEQVKADQTGDVSIVNNTTDFWTFVAIMAGIGLLSTMLGYFASDNIQRWMSKK